MVQQAIGSDIEMIVMGYLDRRNIEYQFQTSLSGGFFETGGAVVDFLIPDGMLAWRVMGEYWHQGVKPEGRDIMQKEMLMGKGYTVVDIWGEDVQNRLDETMRLALQGQNMLR